ncbi:glycosyltransferase, partial [Candidatus Parcubacteria bacterium]|nr:glycosyltransferase [Candidatus Parcubacteria bacterium]
MLSIIIPTLNEEKYLPILLEQIKKQNFSDYEIIVADAGSKDKTVEIAKNFGCIITKGGCPARGRNQGAKLAKGEILWFIDADTLFLPENFLKEILSQMEKKKLDLATFPIFIAGSPIDKIIFRFYYFLAEILQKIFPLGWNSVFVKREVFEKLGGFDESVVFGEDLEFVQRASKKFRYGFIKTKPVLSSSRRFEKDGKIKTYFKYLLAGIYIIFRGPIKKPIFNYDHDYSKV